MKNLYFFFTLVVLSLTGCDFIDAGSGQTVEVNMISSLVEKGVADDKGDITTATFEFELEIIGGSKISYLVLHADTSGFGGVQYKLKSPTGTGGGLVYSTVTTTTAIVRNEGKSDVATILPGRRHIFTISIEVEATADDFYTIEVEEIVFRDRAPLSVNFRADAIYLHRSDRALVVTSLKKIQNLLYTTKKLVSRGELNNAQALASQAREIGHSLGEGIDDQLLALLDLIEVEVNAGTDDSVALAQQAILIIEIHILELLGENYYRKQ